MNDIGDIFQVICNIDYCPENIGACCGLLHEKCMGKGFCSIRNLNESQLKYVVSDINQNVYLDACPGSGKTEVLGMKCAYELKKWTDKVTGIAVLTFTNSAEDEMRSRVEGYLNEGVKYPHFIGTFTSWIHGYIANPFLWQITNYKGDDSGDNSIKLIEDGSNSGFINAFASKYNYGKIGNINASEYYRDIKNQKYMYCGNRTRYGEIILQSLIEKDSWRSKDLQIIKQKFWVKGFFLYDDVELNVLILMHKHKEIVRLLSKRFPIIFVDECQDLSLSQLKMLKILHESGSKIHLIGDLNQAIYGFRNIDPEDTRNFIAEIKCLEIRLKQNYRSCQKIVNVSNAIVGYKKPIEGCQKQLVPEPLVALLYKKDKEKNVIKVFSKLLDENSIDKHNSKIVVRNNTLKNKLLGMKKPNKSSNLLEDLARAIYLANQNAETFNLKESFMLFCKAFQKMALCDIPHSNSNFYYKPDNMDMKEWKLLVLNFKNEIVKEKALSDFSKTWTQWKKDLTVFMDYYAKATNMSYTLGSIRKRNPDKSIESVIIEKSESAFDYEIQTIHGCKGMSIDAVLFMSSYEKPKANKDSGAYWKEWLDTTAISEKNRLAHVAFSRAKHLLVLGIPKTASFDEESRKELVALRFKILDA